MPIYILMIPTSSEMFLLEVKCLLSIIFGHSHCYPRKKLTISTVLQAHFKLVLAYIFHTLKCENVSMCCLTPGKNHHLLKDTNYDSKREVKITCSNFDVKLSKLVGLFVYLMKLAPSLSQPSRKEFAYNRVAALPLLVCFKGKISSS